MDLPKSFRCETGLRKVLLKPSFSRILALPEISKALIPIMLTCW